ncbi:MAG TPA: flagellar FliJ family protein, partial [Phycisphaeraceae bacterium]
MTAFHFQYQSVLEYRRLVEDQRQRELAKHLRVRMILHDQLRAMQQTIRDSKQQLGEALVGRVDLDRIAGFARYSGQAAQRAQQIVARLAQLEKLIETARQHLLEATKQRKALELLRDKHHQRWLQEQQRR